MTLTIALVSKSLKIEWNALNGMEREPTFGCFPSVWNFRHLSEFCWRSRARSCSSSCTRWYHHAARPRTAAPESSRPERPRSSPAPPAPVLCCDPKRRQSGRFSNQSSHIPRNVHQHFTFKCSRPTRNNFLPVKIIESAARGMSQQGYAHSWINYGPQDCAESKC